MPADRDEPAADQPVHRLTMLAVRDLGRSSAFYQQAFGWQVAVAAPVYTEFELPGGQRLGLYQREGFALSCGGEAVDVLADRVSGAELYLVCADLAASIEAILRAGARALSPRAKRDWGDEVAYFRDPDGHVIALASQPLVS